jgi:hypothetical protein
MKTFNDFINEANLVSEKNKPTSHEKWAQAKSAAKSKFAVYPSAYANAWASKKYKSMGGGWKSTSEEVDSGEYDYEGNMAKVQLQTLCRNSKDLIDMLSDDENMPEWVQSKITLAQDYITTVRDYLQSKQELGESLDETAAWQRKAGKDPKGGLNRKGIASYRRENPGSKLSMAVTTKPSKLDPDSKSAKRRKSFCARMGGMKKRLTSAKTAKDPDSRINKALRKWNCN